MLINFNNFTLPFLNCKPLKLLLRVFLASNIVAMVTYGVTKMVTCLPMVGQVFDAMIVASSDKEWLQQPINIDVPETISSP